MMLDACWRTRYRNYKAKAGNVRIQEVKKFIPLTVP